jgi:hypothetical protein
MFVNPTPAAPAPTVARTTNKFDPTVLTLPGRNDIYRELNQTTQSIRSIFPTHETVKEQRSIFTNNSGIMYYHNRGKQLKSLVNNEIAFHAVFCQGRKWWRGGGKTSGPLELRRRRLFARRAPSHHSNIPTFHHSNCAAKFYKTLTHILQTKSFFLSQRIWKNSGTSNTDMFINPTPAAPAPTVAMTINKFNPTPLTFPGRNNFYPELNQTTQLIRSIFPTHETAKEQRSIFTNNSGIMYYHNQGKWLKSLANMDNVYKTLTHTLQTKSFFLSQRIWKNSETYNTNMFVNPIERLFRVTDFYHPERPILMGITPFAGDMPTSAASPGGTGIDKQSAAGQLLPGTDHTYQIFLKNSRLSNMFFHANQRLFRKIHSPVKTRASYPTFITLKAAVFSQYLQTKGNGFYHPILPTLGGVTTFAGDTSASAASPGGTGGENRSSQYSSTSEFVLPVSKPPGDKEDIDNKRITTFSNRSTDLYYPMAWGTYMLRNSFVSVFTHPPVKARAPARREMEIPMSLTFFNPLQRVGNDLEKSITINDMSSVNNTSGVRGINNSSLDSIRNVEMEKAKPMIDVGQLTEQVYRMLERKIGTERQRRGW